VITAPPPAPPAQLVARDDDRERRAQHRRLGRIAIYGGIGLEIVTGTFMYLGANLNNQIRSNTFETADAQRNAQSLGTVFNWTAIVAGTLGVASIATGVTLIVKNGDVQDVRVSATTSSGFSGLVLSGRM